MRTGVSYMGHHNPRHVEIDLKDIKSVGCDDVLLGAQENDFVYMTGKLDFFSKLAEEQGLRPLAIFWGAVNYFGGGRSSQFLLNNPKAHQVNQDGSYNPAGCYNNPDVVRYIKDMIDRIAGLGFAGYFIDEPSPINCFCAACAELFSRHYNSSLHQAERNIRQEFRRKCVCIYIREISEYIKSHYPDMETLCCIMPHDKMLWQDAAQIKAIDDLGTDIYWVNNDTNVEQMRPLIRDISNACTMHNKKHHQWLQCWGVQKGKEHRIKEQGEILLDTNPDALYVWAYQGQIGTSESCDDPQAAWDAACEILRKAKKI
ncbi:MAG: hypothetical protein V1739_02990 [Candidatus Omnitrophota bacterium]